MTDRTIRRTVALAVVWTLVTTLSARAAEPGVARPPRSDADLRQWLENMVWYHGYSLDEIEDVTGLPPARIVAALDNYNISAATRPVRGAEEPLLVVPYPGGRHPRIGFLEGAIRPQRETKVSVFLPWDPSQYVVVDVPEAIWSNLGLTYLAHTHVETVWDRQGIDLEPLEWERLDDGSLRMERTLPNGIRFGSHVVPHKDHVAMRMWLHNGTDQPLSDLRVQNCVMLKAAEEFNQQTNDNKVTQSPYIAVRNAAGNRWVITGWEPIHRPWGNQRCPCLHADPKFPDCAPGETQHLTGWLSFYEGDDLSAELKRIDATGWRTR